MASYSARPPYATDEPDSAYADLPKPTPRPRKKQDDETGPGGARETTYATFDSYFAGNEPDNRTSGVGDIGRGLMNVDTDSDDSDDERVPKSKAQPSQQEPANKHRVLFEAATGMSNSAPDPQREPSRDALEDNRNQSRGQLRAVQQPQAVMHRGQDWPVSQAVEPSTPPGLPRSMMGEQRGPGTPIQARAMPLAAPAPAHYRPMQPAFMESPASPFRLNIPGSPSPRTPQPLPPPQTPITPVFAQPKFDSSVKFNDVKVEIIRGDTEETLLPRGRGGKGDEFWKRFSMVAREEAKTGSQSAWLRKTQGGTTRLATWVWAVGILCLLIIGGACGLGWYFTHNKAASQPLAIGGSAGETQGSETTTTGSSVAAGESSVRATKVSAVPFQSSTVVISVITSAAITARDQGLDNDFLPTAAPTPIPALHRGSLTNRLHH